MNTKAMTSAKAVPLLLRELRLPSVCSSFLETADQAQRGGWSYIEYLKTLCEIELTQRRRHRVERNLRRSQLPASKTLSTLDVKRLPPKVQRILPVLCEGGFVSKGENILAFGLPGRGKTHLCSAIGHELIHRGYQVLFIPTFRLVQSLLVAKRDLRLDTELRRLDRFDVVILDDIGYVQQERDEMEVLFTFLSERYERRSIMITSNLVFSEWDKIFKNPMTTAAAIDSPG
jgi:DNA replication protein DnaC